MNDEIDKSSESQILKEKRVAKYSPAALQAIGGAVPFAGGVFSTIAGAWPEGEQENSAV
jgi:hypothetical protein